MAAGEVIVGYDGGEGADKALAVGLDLAKDLGAKVLLAFAYEPVHLAGVYGEKSDHRRAIKEFADERLGEGLEKAKAAGVDASALLVDARPAEGLAEEAKERGARMIVVGSQGSPLPLVGHIIGSVSHKLVQISEVPVLVVHTTD
jgi:nucleotide-binding universal stress UspA family protein